MKSLAALLRQSGEPLPYAATRPLEIVEVDLAPPRTGEVLVKIESAGICHSDLSVINGSRPRPLPLVAGHESAGVIVELGAGVKDLKVGDHVTSVFLPITAELSAAWDRMAEEIKDIKAMGYTVDIVSEIPEIEIPKKVE